VSRPAGSSGLASWLRPAACFGFWVSGPDAVLSACQKVGNVVDSPSPCAERTHLMAGVWGRCAVALSVGTVAATFGVDIAVAWITGEGAAVTFGVTGLASPPHAPIIATKNMKAASFMRR
jgi:hypothetical protein